MNDALGLSVEVVAGAGEGVTGAFSEAAVEPDGAGGAGAAGVEEVAVVEGVEGVFDEDADCNFGF